MPEARYTVYRYRWVLLAAYAGNQAGMQRRWLPCAQIGRATCREREIRAV